MYIYILGRPKAWLHLDYLFHLSNHVNMLNVYALTVTMFLAHPVYIYINFMYFYFNVVKESTILNCANHCRNWTFKRFARVAEKKERNGTNKENLTFSGILSQAFGYIYI